MTAIQGHLVDIVIALVGIVISSLTSIYSLEIKKFLSIPPQHLQRWVLKAQLLAVETQLYESSRRSDIQSLIVHISIKAVQGIVLLFASMIILILSMIIPLPTWLKPFEILGFSVACTYGFLIFWSLGDFLVACEIDPSGEIETEVLSKRRLRLRKRLGVTDEAP